MRSPIEFMCGGHGAKPKKKMMTAGTAVFACYSAACAPPSAGGTGGSIAGKGPRGRLSYAANSLLARQDKMMRSNRDTVGGGNLTRVDGVRSHLSEQGRNARSPQMKKFFESAEEGARMMAEPSVSLAYARKKMVHARVQMNAASEESVREHWKGWLHGAEKAAMARWNA